MSHVVVGVDRSETSRRAAYRAARLASAFGSRLHLVTCAKPEAGETIGIGSDAMTTDWQHDAEQFLQGLARELPHDDVTWSVSSGDPANAIVTTAGQLEADTIVVGNVRSQGAARVLGSVASSVVRKAPCDVLVAHTA